MSHVRSLHFDALEARRVPSTARVAAVHTAPVVAAAPLVLNGTLAVADDAGSTNMNADGSSTESLPVAGRLGALGKVRGAWYESTDAYGDITGTDMIRLHASNGTFIIAFNNQTPGQAHSTGNGTVYYVQAQRVYHGTGAYARPSEIGSIELVENAAQTLVQSLVLHTRKS